MYVQCTKPDTTVKVPQKIGGLGKFAGIDLSREVKRARQVVLDWQRTADQFGRSKVTIELVGEQNLPPDWFEYSAHSHVRRDDVSTE